MQPSNFTNSSRDKTMPQQHRRLDLALRLSPKERTFGTVSECRTKPTAYHRKTMWVPVPSRRRQQQQARQQWEMQLRERRRMMDGATIGELGLTEVISYSPVFSEADGQACPHPRKYQDFIRQTKGFSKHYLDRIHQFMMPHSSK